MYHLLFFAFTSIAGKKICDLNNIFLILSVCVNIYLLFSDIIYDLKMFACRFINLGIKPPKGVLMYGPPGTGKTLMARACAAQTNSCFLKLAGPQLVQMFIGDGAKLVRDAFALAKEKAPAIIFIDELDAIGTKRFDSEKAGDREVQRTMLELLNQLDGFSSNDDIKVSYSGFSQYR